MIRPTLAALMLTGSAATAQSLPPASALPLSQVIAGVEATQPVRAITEVEWDDDGYWDVEVVNTDNRRAAVRVDPMTGEPWQRRRR